MGGPQSLRLPAFALSENFGLGYTILRCGENDVDDGRRNCAVHAAASTGSNGGEYSP